jgi:hypothetical protein
MQQGWVFTFQNILFFCLPGRGMDICLQNPYSLSAETLPQAGNNPTNCHIFAAKPGLAILLNLFRRIRILASGNTQAFGLSYTDLLNFRYTYAKRSKSRHKPARI